MKGKSSQMLLAAFFSESLLYPLTLPMADQIIRFALAPAQGAGQSRKIRAFYIPLSPDRA